MPDLSLRLGGVADGHLSRPPAAAAARGAGEPATAARPAGARLAAHWLAAANSVALAVVALAVLAPTLIALGLSGPADFLYQLYTPLCHQWASRSFFLFGSQATHPLAELIKYAGTSQAQGLVGNTDLGYKLAFCQRDLAIYGAIWLSGLVYAARRPRAAPLPLGWYLLACLPMAVDGFSQLQGWRESNWELRLVTGALFGLASVWFLYPRIDAALLGRRGGPSERAVQA